MRRFAITLIAIFLTALACAAQKKDEDKACVSSYKASFVLSSPSTATFTVEKNVTVYSEDGLDVASMICADDDFRNLASFSATVSPRNGSKAGKAGMKDVSRIGGSHGQVDNFITNIWVPSAPYPFDVTMKYVINYRGAVPTFPFFFPIETDGTSVREAVYSITVPEGYEIKWAASSEPEKGSVSHKDTYTWTFRDLPALVHEPMMPSIREIAPYVISGPQDFVYLGTKGSQRTWEDLAAWNASLFPKKDLPEELVTRITRETDGMSDVEKLRYVYDYLRSNTRYVSIQLGIGGFAPASPASVCRTGYGDCKALSFFAHTLLETIGVRSSYTILDTGRSSFIRNFPSMGQTNHAMLCVPLQKDTVWVECTNPAMPLGYRHRNIAGHQVVLVNEEDGGRMVRVPRYPDTLTVKHQSSEILVREDGSASISSRITCTLRQAEALIGASDWDRSEQIRNLSAGFRAPLDELRVTTVSDNFGDYNGDPGYIPEASIGFTLTSNRYATLSGDRILVPVMPFSRSIETRRSERVHDFVTGSPVTIEEDSVVRIPDGYRVESLPNMPNINTPYLDISGTSSLEGDHVKIRIVTRLKSGQFPKEHYADFREAARNLGRAYAGNLVLIRN